ncbi:MAG TPA: ribosome biogenesis GTPase Der [Bacteroidota bacterium]|nr:ribosome biogenesis GTPase Der [Bacteroidota bacterium]
MPSNIIAIVGRPNVGKSTLFNRILGFREAIVHDAPGVTRDRKYGDAEWAGTQFTVIDTGGYVPRSEDVFELAIREQAQIAVEEADLVLFMVDAKDGILPLDKEIAGILRKSEKPILLVVNKIDSAKQEMNSAEFFALGLGDPISISALGGRQIGDFLDEVTSHFKAESPEPPGEKPLRIAVVGKPNVGKSSLVNALLGKKRQVVTDIPGTTRDPIDSILTYQGEEIVLVDTAGLKKKSKVAESVEFYSALRTLRSIERSDVVVILLDASRPIDHQDLHIVESTVQRKRSALIAVNKWDLIEKDSNTVKAFEQAISMDLGMYDYFPVVFVSALTKQRVSKIIDMAKEIEQEQSKRIKTGELNDTLLAEIENYPPKTSSPKEIKIKYVTQLKTKPPLFGFFCNEPKLVQESYKRFLSNKIREHFGFKGVPITIMLKKK